MNTRLSAPARARAFLRSALCWDKPFFRNVVLVALPMIVQELLGASLHIVDSLMVSGLGDAAYSAVTQANRYSFIGQLFIFGTCTGAGIYFSQYWGARDIKRMRGTLGIGLVLSLSIGTLFMLGALLAPEAIVSAFLPRGVSFDIAVTYLRAVAPSYLLIAVSNTFATCIKAAERTYIPMLAGMASIVTNTVLNYGMIYGHFGFPAMGVTGAAVATIISAAVAMAVNLGCAYGMRLPAGATLRQLLGFREKGFARKFLRTVTPVIFNEGLWALGTSMYSVFYGRMGDVSVAAMGICSNIDSLVWVFLFAMMNATAIIVGKALGSGDKDRAYLYAKRMMAGAMLLAALLGVVLIVIRAPLVQLFGGLSQGVRDKAMVILFYGALTMWFRAFNTVNVVGVLRSGGDTMFSLILDAGCLWVISVPLTGVAALVLHWDIEYVYCCTFVEEAVKVLIGIPHFKKRKWMNILTEPKEGS